MYIRIARICMFGILLTLTCCDSQSTIIPSHSYQVWSLREYYPLLEAEAKQWHKDAYLVYATVSLVDWNNPITSAFRSPSENYESVLVSIAPDETIKMEIIEHKIPDYQLKPIIESDWPIDSQAALDKMLDEDAIEFLSEHQMHCSDLKLERFLPIPEEPVVWSLAIADCGRNARYIYLDPVSGEILDLKR